MNSTETIPERAAWDDALLRDPHSVSDKRSRVQRMFAAIAPSYDLNNRLHSLGVDQLWRGKAVKLAQIRPNDVILDVACGTGDLTLQFEAARQRQGGVGRVFGIDFTFEMLPPARRKTTAAAGSAAFAVGDAQSLPFPDASADVISIAFGIRNVANIAAALAEFRRVLRPGGRLIILEFSLPANPVLRGLYNFYFRKILPFTATLVSGDKTGAYKYLPESVNTFIGREEMLAMMQSAGFESAEQHAMTFGVCICYRGVVRDAP